MKETEIRGMIADVKKGVMSRRSFIQKMAAVGIVAPLASQLLVWHDVAMAQTPVDYPPTQAGGGGTLKILLWQAPTLLNPAFASGTKDQFVSRIFYQPLAGWDTDGNLVAQLAAEIPSRENGGLAEDGKSVVWKLKEGVKWHDGKPFTADDVVFTWEFCRDPASAAYTLGSYKDINVVKVDDLTVRVEFPEPMPFWADAFVGTIGMILPKHQFEGYVGATSRDAPANLVPVGTGPYKIVDFKPGDILIAERNTEYHVPNQPHFDRVEVKGGGDAVSAATAILQTGEYDFGNTISVEDAILQRLESAGKGRVVFQPSGDLEVIMLNVADPWTEVEGERAHVSSVHPSLSDPEVRRALNLLVDRDSIIKHIFGRAGTPTANFVNLPVQFTSDKLTYEFNIEKANEVLEAAGWTKGSDGVREKNGVKLKYVFQTSINSPRQKVQALYKQTCAKAGIEIELKSVTSSVYFSTDIANPDTYGKFFADIEMFGRTQTQPDPYFFLSQCVSWEISQKSNGWQGRNFTRYADKEADELYIACKTELDPVKRTAMMVRINEIFCEANVVIPVFSRNRVAAVANNLVNKSSSWDIDTWDLASWYRT